MEENYRLIAKTLQSLEPVLAKELETLGATDIKEGRRMVSFAGSKEMLYKANYHLRTALRILRPIASFHASSPDELYEELRRLDWGQWMRPTDTFAFDTVVYSETFTHSKYAGYRAKDALADYFREKHGTRPMVRLDNPDLLFHIHISHEEVTLALDSSGESLHKRGWRMAQTEAPMSEVLAAGILLMAGWSGETDFIDPMCGSGTLLVEAALIARGIAPGSFRKRGFAFQRWRDYDAELFEQIKADHSGERTFAHHIYGSDSSMEAVQIARHNVRAAGLTEEITILHRSMQQCPAPEAPALIVTNPPYGERLRMRDAEELYGMIGERLKHNYAGSTAWILAYRPEHFDHIGLRHSARHKLLNGALECELRAYELFAGKRDDFKRRDRERDRAFRPERPRGERSERPRGERSARPAGERSDRPRRSASDRPRRDWEERPRRDRDDCPRRDREDRPKRRYGFADEGARERKQEGGKERTFAPRDEHRRPKRTSSPRPEGKPREERAGLWPNDRFKYRDEEGRERTRPRRFTPLQTFGSEGKDKEED